MKRRVLRKRDRAEWCTSEGYRPLLPNIDNFATEANQKIERASAIRQVRPQWNDWLIPAVATPRIPRFGWGKARQSRCGLSRAVRIPGRRHSEAIVREVRPNVQFSVSSATRSFARKSRSAQTSKRVFVIRALMKMGFSAGATAR